MKFEPIMLAGALALASGDSGAQILPRITIPSVQGNVTIIDNENKNGVNGKPEIVVVIPGTPRVSREFATAVHNCILKNGGSGLYGVWQGSFPCELPGMLGANERDFIDYQGYSIVAQYIGKGKGNQVELQRGQAGLGINRGIMSNPTQIQNQVPDCRSLMPSNTNISSGGRVVINSINTDGYSGSMINGVKCN